MVEPERPATTQRAEAARLERQAREAAVLRNNLLRRKQQARARDAASAAASPATQPLPLLDPPLD